MGLFEVMEVSDSLRTLILAGAPVGELRSRAVEEGMLTLRQGGMQRIAQGITTVDEVTRETVR